MVATDPVGEASSDVAVFAAGLPKCELHLHIEGTLEPELAFALAARNGIVLEHESVEAVRAAYDFDSLSSFLVVYYASMRVLVTEQDFYDLAWAYLERAARENIRCAEIFFDPQAHTSRGVPFPTVIGGLRRAALDAHRTLGVRASLIMCFLRDFSADYAMATLMESLPYKGWIIGVGLDSDERDNPPVKFAEVFARARAEGYLLTMHCDVDQLNTTEHIRQALDVIGVDRIDHGVNSVQDESLIEKLVSRGIGLTTCPVSNRFVTGSQKAAEIVQLLERGVKVTVNSDDPAYFAAYVTDNLVSLQREAGLSLAQLVQLERNAFDIAWLPAGVRDGFLAELDDYAARAGSRT